MGEEYGVEFIHHNNDVLLYTADECILFRFEKYNALTLVEKKSLKNLSGVNFNVNLDEIIYPWLFIKRGPSPAEFYNFETEEKFQLNEGEYVQYRVGNVFLTSKGSEVAMYEGVDQLKQGKPTIVSKTSFLYQWDISTEFRIRLKFKSGIERILQWDSNNVVNKIQIPGAVSRGIFNKCCVYTLKTPHTYVVMPLSECLSKDPKMYQLCATFPKQLFSDVSYSNMGFNEYVNHVDDQLGIIILTAQRKFVPANRRHMAILGYSLMSGELIFHHSGLMVPPIIFPQGIVVQSETDLDRKHTIEVFRFD